MTALTAPPLEPGPLALPELIASLSFSHATRSQDPVNLGNDARRRHRLQADARAVVAVLAAGAVARHARGRSLQHADRSGALHERVRHVRNLERPARRPRAEVAWVNRAV